MIKNKFKITGMHCTSCAFNIDGELEDTDGVDEANTNFAKAETEVKFDPEKVSVDKIIKLIKSVGYTATLA
jgi:Cu+-exporting ATPase